MTIMPDSPDIENKCWHALSAPYRRELKAKQFLDERGIENFIPMRYSVVTRRSGEKLRKLMPAVRNLVFAKASREVMKDLKSEAAFLQYRTMRRDGRNVPITIPDREMENFISACKSGACHRAGGGGACRSLARPDRGAARIAADGWPEK